MISKYQFNLLILTVLFFPSGFALAAASPGQHHGQPHDMGVAMQAKKKHHAFTAHWTQTLNEAQARRVDQMHLQLAQEQGMLKAQLQVYKTELNQLAIAERADHKAIAKKIDQIVQIKGQLMKLRFEHIVEMRAELSPEQRITYDMGVLNRDRQRH